MTTIYAGIASGRTLITFNFTKLGLNDKLDAWCEGRWDNELGFCFKDFALMLENFVSRIDRGMQMTTLFIGSRINPCCH